MTVNYEDIGFKAGLEIHQQLDTSKLFCYCPSVNDDSVDFTVNRKLRASAGETGKVDVAAKFEMAKDKTFTYQSNKTNSCLVELDSEPPHNINIKAVKIVLEIAKLLNATILPEIEVMRKVVIDGSNTTGFQRTALIAVNGSLDTTKGKVEIATICLEEDSAKRIRNESNKSIFHLSRLGIPLIEIATSPDIVDNEHAKEVAQQIGMILRSTGKVRRGLGTIRQDVNLSIRSSSRVEIKGFQDLRQMPIIIEKEVQRLSSTKNHKPEVRKANEDGTTSFLRPLPGASRMYPETDVPTLVIDKKILSEIKLPELLSEKVIKLEKTYKISSNIAKDIIETGYDFESLVKTYRKVDPKIIFWVLIEVPKEIKTRFGIDTNKITQNHIKSILNNLNNQNITKDIVVDLLAEASKGKLIDFTKYKPISLSKIEEDIKKIIEQNKGASINAIMGIVMGKYRGKVEGKILSQIVKKYI